MKRFLNGYLKWENGKFWQQDFWCLTASSTGQSISLLGLPAAILKYLFNDRKKLKRHRELQEKHIKGKSVDAALKNARDLGYLA